MEWDGRDGQGVLAWIGLDGMDFVASLCAEGRPWIEGANTRTSRRGRLLVNGIDGGISARHTYPRRGTDCASVRHRTSRHHA